MAPRRPYLRLFVAPVVLVALAACEEPPAETQERVRAIKTYTVVEPAGGSVRRYSGTLAAANTAGLSFAVSGTVASVAVKIGDTVRRDQALAGLDTRPFALDVAAAQSQLNSERAKFEKAEIDLERKRDLFSKGWVAKAALDEAVSAFEAAEGALSLARSRLGLAKRDLDNASLKAPFDGVISARDVEPFVEVQRGQTILQIDSKGVLEVDFSVPDDVVSRLSVGSPVTISSTAVSGCGCTGRITEIGTSAGAANAVTVTAGVVDGPPNLLPGMAVEAGVTLASDGGPRGYLVPLVAIAPGEGSDRGFVFRFDTGSKTVQRVPVRAGETVQGNLVSIAEGLNAGDIIAAAGVSFLRDGQRVKLLGE